MRVMKEELNLFTSFWPSMSQQKAERVFDSLKLIQKEIRGYESVVFDLATQARNNRRNLQAILERADMKNF